MAITWGPNAPFELNPNGPNVVCCTNATALVFLCISATGGDYILFCCEWGGFLRSKMSFHIWSMHQYFLLQTIPWRKLSSNKQSRRKGTRVNLRCFFVSPNRLGIERDIPSLQGLNGRRRCHMSSTQKSQKPAAAAPDGDRCLEPICVPDAGSWPRNRCFKKGKAKETKQAGALVPQKVSW